MGIIMIDNNDRGDRREGHGKQGQREDRREEGRDRGREGVTRRKVETKDKND